MMMSKPRPSEEEEGETDAATQPTKPAAVAAPEPVVEKILPSNPEEAIEALEQRLELLGGATADGSGGEAADAAVAPPAAEAAPELVPTEDEKEEDNPTPPAPAPEPAPAPAVAAPAPIPAPVAAPAPAAVAKPAQQQAAGAGGKSALLARIMAAQERAKAAEEQRKAFEEELNRPKQAPRNAAEEQEKILKALSGESDKAKKPAASKADEPPPPPFEVAEAGAKTELPPPFEVAEAAMKPPPFEVAAQTMAPPSFASVEDAIPPPFEAVEKSEAAAMSNGSKQVKFDESTKAPAPTVPAPSAPTFDPLEVAPAPAAAAASDADLGLLIQEGFDSVVPPPASNSEAPPSFEQFEANTTEATDDAAFEFDLDGNPLSPEERKKMMEEQRAIMEQIQRESAANAKAIAAAQAENFDQRSGSAAVRAVGGGGGQAGPARASAGRPVGATDEDDDVDDTDGRTVEIGGGQNVALHGQAKTKKAIADGTAVLVQCVNCQNWMQVTETATLMFCPVCSVVSPVTKQDEVMTKEEAIQLTMDRKLAEQLQAEINAEAAAEAGERRQRGSEQQEEGYMAAALRKLRGEEAPEGAGERLISGSTASSGHQRHATNAPQEKSWWDTFSEYVGVGVPEGANERRAGEISVSRPPGAAAAGAGTARSSSRTDEQRGLLASVDGNGSAAGTTVVRDSPPVGLPHPGMQSARVAESKPLFSCVVDSVSSAASAVGTALTHTTLGDGEGDIHGVDSNSLLSVTQVGRGQGSSGSGSYHQLESNGNL